MRVFRRTERCVSLPPQQLEKVCSDEDSDSSMKHIAGLRGTPSVHMGTWDDRRTNRKSSAESVASATSSDASEGKLVQQHVRNKTHAQTRALMPN
jgi:hypothetical protein